MEEKNNDVIFEGFFSYRKGQFHVEEADVRDLAREYKTPSYIYSRNFLVSQIEKMKESFAAMDTLICYSVKANSNLSILKIMKKFGYGADVVSEGELRRALLAGFKPDSIVFAGVGKKEEEIEYGIRQKINCFNIENEDELSMIEKLGKKLKSKVVCNLRLNLDIDVDTHHYVKTSRKETKFGIDLVKAEEILRRRGNYKYALIKGFHLHLGSQLKDVSPYIKALEKVSEFSKRTGFYPEIIDLGGGFGIAYSTKDKVMDICEFGGRITSAIKSMGVKKLILEPGRFIVGNTAVLLTKVLYVKRRGEKNFIIVDAAMNDLIRPAFYGSHHAILPVAVKGRADDTIKADVVGPICETGDYLGKDIDVPAGIKKDDFLVIASAGAYAFSMSSNYNSRLRPCEILVDGGKISVIRKRENYSDLWKSEL
ncbi:MAG TPA: diaminopimelate decarboxylase [bacterium]|nr:diaminopimelate decarboxylase [bacterium]